jgi:hypothetical protein
MLTKLQKEMDSAYQLKPGQKHCWYSAKSAESWAPYFGNEEIYYHINGEEKEVTHSSDSRFSYELVTDKIYLGVGTFIKCKKVDWHYTKKWEKEAYIPASFDIDKEYQNWYDWFKKNLYQSMGIPISLMENGPYSSYSSWNTLPKYSEVDVKLFKSISKYS